MANSYRQFSETVSVLTQGEEIWLRGALEDTDELSEEDYAAWVQEYRFLELCDADFWPAFEWDIVRVPNGIRYLWLYSEGSGDVKAVGALLSRFLELFRPDDDFSLTWADTCSKPRFGQFGGGWMYVTKDSIEFGNVWDAVAKAKEV